jgi:hypothetical protein
MLNFQMTPFMVQAVGRNKWLRFILLCDRASMCYEAAIDFGLVVWPFRLCSAGRAI